jgi:Cof subfamily protein (haloacid dehalogenase superfamily)
VSRPSVVATDLDGTIVRSDGTISDRTRRALALAEDAGALVVFVTGRPPRWLAPIADATGHRGLAVCANGALVYDLHTEQVVKEHPLAPAQALELVNALRESLPGVTFAVERGTGFGHEPAYRPRWQVPQGTVVADVEALVSRPVAKLLARHEHLDADTLLARAREVVATSLATLTHSSREGLLEVSAAGISKASTLEALVAGHGYAAADVVAFGDMPNDLPLLAWAGRGIAVANAHPEVLAAVEEVTASNDEDGVAQVLEALYR